MTRPKPFGHGEPTLPADSALSRVVNQKNGGLSIGHPQSSGDEPDALRVEVDFAVPVGVERRLHELRPAGGEVRHMLRACVDAELLGIDLPQGALERRRRGVDPVARTA